MIRNFTFFVGLPGCGKSTYIAENVPNHTCYSKYTNNHNGTYVAADFYSFCIKYSATPIVVSADEIKESFNGYNPNEAYKIHQESVQLAKEYILKMAADKDVVFNNVILDGGGVNNHYNQDIIEFIRQYSEGCHIKMVYFDTPIEVCLKRIETRERKVPVDDIYNKNLRIVSCLNRYMPLVDEFVKIPYFTNKYLMLDMDGTIAGYGKVRKDKEGNSDFVNSELFINLKPVQHIIDYVKDNFDMKNVYIMTAVANIVAWNEKLAWLEKYFPEIPKENILFVGNKNYKHVFIKHWAIKQNWKINDITLVDDLHSTIDDCKNIGINCIHPSNIESLTDKYTFFA